MEYHIKLLVSLLITFSLITGLKAKDIEFSIFELTTIAQKIYQNECAGKLENLVFWSERECFASIGIGHFIWYPDGVEKKFEESFPKLIEFMQHQGIIVPIWLKDAPANLWHSKEEMQQDPRAVLLRQFMQQTISIQAYFMAKRINDALPKILSAVTPSRHQKITSMFDDVANSENGYYLLIDYVNFKGEGIKESERYNGKGWGLLQVLECMQKSTDPKAEFARCAKEVLATRVQNAPDERNETQWLKGWYKRIDTYTAP